jgi:hypothetical protein
MGMCLYCRERRADSEDHIFPRFLGGKRTISACRPCNSKFGHVFEGAAARELEPIYVLLAKWGVPIPPRDQLWRNAFEASNAQMHLGVGEMGVRAESAKPIIVKDAEGKITEALFADPRQLAVFNETMNRRYPDQRWEPVEKIVRTDLRGLKLELRLGWAVQQLALKMAVASASLLPNVTASDLQGAANTLHEPACEYHPRVSSDLPRNTSSLARPALCHSIYVERSNGRLSALVELFGAIRYFVHLADLSSAAQDSSQFIYLDPVCAREEFQSVAPLMLGTLPLGYTADQMIQIQLDIVRALGEGAVARGATSLPSGKITARLPISGDIRT